MMMMMMIIIIIIIIIGHIIKYLGISNTAAK